MIPRLGERVFRERTYIHRPGVYAVLPLRRHVLMTFQEEPLPEIQLPGGGIDRGEQPIQALHREVLEETGWRIDAPRKIGAFRRFVLIPEYEMWAEKVCHIYIARPVARLGPPSEPGHHAILMPHADAIAAATNAVDQFVLRSLYD